MSISAAASDHPLVTVARSLAETLDDVAGVDPVFMSTRDKQSVLTDLTRVLARVTALRGDVLAVADDVAALTADRSPGTWLATATRTDQREAVRDHRLGTTLRDRWPLVRDAVTTGRITWDQAGIITRALDDLPTGPDPALDPGLVTKAEAHLLTEADQFGPRPLRRLGAKLLQVIAPDLADEHEHRLMLAQEHRAHTATRLAFRPRGDGSTDLHARLPDAIAHRLKTYLDAYTSPRRTTAHTTDTEPDPDPEPEPGSEGDQLPLPRRRGEAFCTLLEHIPAKGLPHHGGTATQVLVMIDYDTLTNDLARTGVADTSTGDSITASHARRLACTAGIIPVVLGGHSQVLDLGRTRRLFTGPIRVALDLRDRGCRAQGCDIPAAWCEAHHRQPWTHHGHTNLHNGVLLCSHHHHRAHDPAYHHTLQPNGDITFHRRT